MSLILRPSRAKILCRASLSVFTIGALFGAVFVCLYALEPRTSSDLWQWSIAQGAFMAVITVAVVAGTRRELRRRIVLEKRAIRIEGRLVPVVGPAYFSTIRDSRHPLPARALVIPTRDGPVCLDDDYLTPLEEVRDFLPSPGTRTSATPKILPSTGDFSLDRMVWSSVAPEKGSAFTLRDRGMRLRLSWTGWIYVLIAAALAFVIAQDRWGLFPSAGVHAVVGILTISLGVGIAFLRADPSRLYRSWMVVTRKRLLIVHDGVWCMLVESVKDVRRVGRFLEIECRNGRRIRFPDLALEAEARIACGLDARPSL